VQEFYPGESCWHFGHHTRVMACLLSLTESYSATHTSMRSALLATGEHLCGMYGILLCQLAHTVASLYHIWHKPK
jgi:hypothetical protein